MKFGLVVVGDEILSGRRRDRHQAFFMELLREWGFALYWVKILPDDPELLVAELRQSMQAGQAVFCCGGIGATPDDHTRECAARAAGVPLVRHREAAHLIESRFGSQAYPHRIRMADLPQGAELIPNPINQVPGFAIAQHYFLPGFPDMAHPMGRWVLAQHYAPVVGLQEKVIRVYGVSENELMPLLQQLAHDWPQLKLFSLPRMAPERFVDVGFRGRKDLDTAFAQLQRGLRALNIEFEVMTTP